MPKQINVTDVNEKPIIIGKTISYEVTVASGSNIYGSGNKYIINGETSPSLNFIVGNVDYTSGTAERYIDINNKKEKYDKVITLRNYKEDTKQYELYKEQHLKQTI